MKYFSKSDVRIFIAKSLMGWRFRVLTAHAASLVLGITSGLIGLLSGPMLQALLMPGSKLIPWSDILGKLMSGWLSPYLPPLGLDPDFLLTRLPIFLVVVATVKALALFYQWFTWEWIGEQVAKSWRFDVARCFVGIGNEARDDGLVKVQEEQLGGLIAQDIRILREFVVHYYGGLPREGLQVAFTGLGLFALSPKLFLIFVLCIAPVGALLSKYGRKIRKRSSRALNDNSQLSEWIQQRLLGLETIKHYGSETKESELMTSASSNLFERFRAAARLKSRTSPVIEAFGVVAMSIALAVAFQDIADHRLSGAVVMSFFSMLALFAQSAAKLGRYMNSNQDGEAAGERILMVLDQFQQHAERSDNLESSSEARLMNGSFLQTLIVRAPGDHTKISVKNLFLNYTGSSQWVLNDLSFEFHGGRVYCLVGKSGAGKSSLFNAILGLRAPIRGSISATVAKGWRRSEGVNSSLSLVYLPQTVPVVPTSLKRNVAYPNLVADTSRVAEALRQAHFQVSESRLTEGLGTRVGPGHLQLSGGEAQRLQLARLYYHQSPFVLVDEGTSALDPVTEQNVLKTLRALADDGACVIMIAHRLAAAQASDEVLLMEGGKISRSGPPELILSLPDAQLIFG